MVSGFCTETNYLCERTVRLAEMYWSERVTSCSDVQAVTQSKFGYKWYVLTLTIKSVSVEGVKNNEESASYSNFLSLYVKEWHFNIHIISRCIQSHSPINKFYIKNFFPLVRVAILLLNKWYSQILNIYLHELEITIFFGHQKRSLKYAELKILQSSSWPDTSSYQIVGLRACYINTTITEQIPK
jgi:hypothetical protein